MDAPDRVGNEIDLGHLGQNEAADVVVADDFQLDAADRVGNEVDLGHLGQD